MYSFYNKNSYYRRKMNFSHHPSDVLQSESLMPVCLGSICHWCLCMMMSQVYLPISVLLQFILCHYSLFCCFRSLISLCSSSFHFGVSQHALTRTRKVDHYPLHNLEFVPSPEVIAHCVCFCFHCFAFTCTCMYM